MARLLGGTPYGPYEEPPDLAVTIPIGLPGAELPPVLIVAGASPWLPYDDL